MMLGKLRYSHPINIYIGLAKTLARKAVEMAAQTAYYFEEIPMNWISATEKELERRLYADELSNAMKCSAAPAFTELTMKKTGQKFVVARARRWNGSEYEYKVQILTDDCKNIVKEYGYKESDQYPLFTAAVTLIRLNYQYRYFDED